MQKSNAKWSKPSGGRDLIKGKNLGATVPMVGRIWVKVSENLDATTVATVVPVDSPWVVRTLSLPKFIM